MGTVIPFHSVGAMAREPFDPKAQGFHLLYHVGEANRCPGCGQTQWLVGRKLAECCFCATALPIAGAKP